MRIDWPTTSGTNMIPGSVGLLAWTLSAACTSASWSAPARDLEGPWASYRAWEAGSVTILATSVEAARDVRETVEEVSASLTANGIDTGRGVVIAVDQYDAPLIADTSELWSRMDTWHAAATGAESPGAAMLLGGGTGPEVLRLGVAAGIPAGGVGLDLPLEGADWAAIVPTGAALATVTFDLYQRAIERNGRLDIDFERSYSGLPVTRLRTKRELLAHARVRLCATILAARDAGGAEACPDPLPAERVDHLLARLAAARMVYRDGEYRLE